MMISCSETNQPIITKDYPEDHLICWDNIFKQTEKEYLVYFYSDYCGHCQNIKDEVLQFYCISKYKMYFVNATNDAKFGSDVSSFVGINDPYEFFIPGTPFLTIIKDHALCEYYAGVNAIRIFMKNN